MTTLAEIQDAISQLCPIVNRLLWQSGSILGGFLRRIFRTSNHSFAHDEAIHDIDTGNGVPIEEGRSKVASSQNF